jgi:RND family efflux transporter MFP subunit
MFPPTPLERAHRWPAVAPVVAAATLVACAACGESPGGPAGGPPPAGVEVLTLALHPIERTTEYLGTVRSRRTTTIRPQVDGRVTRIVARSGDVVGSGDPLLEIDSDRQRAAVANLESVRAVRVADLEYARQEIDRQRALLAAGASSQREFELAQAALTAAEAQLRAIDEQIREAQVELAYHRIVAPTGGVVTDVRVRVGDRVGPETVLTTIVANEGLELYVYVPVRHGAELRPGLPIQVVDDAGGETDRTAIGFVSPEVDDRTQGILVKAPLEAGRGYRNEQFLRVRIVWSAEPGLTVPVTAVTRISGRHFAFVAVEADGRVVARQRGLEVGEIVGNDYLVLDGLAPGELLVVSGVQKIGDGSPLAPRPAAPPAGTAADRG